MMYAGILIDCLRAAQFQYPLKLPDIFQAISTGNKIEHNPTLNKSTSFLSRISQNTIDFTSGSIFLYLSHVFLDFISSTTLSQSSFTVFVSCK